MRKISKAIVLLLSVIVFVFGVVGCTADTQNDLQAKIDGLQSQLEEMQDKLAEREEQIRDNNATIEDLKEQIRDRDATIEDLKELIDKLEQLKLQISDRDATIEELNEQIKNLKEQIERLEDRLAAVTGYSAVYEGSSYNWSEDRKDFVGICNSKDDLIKLCTENNYGFYDEENSDYQSVLGKKVREYTEEFFISKSLVVCAFTDSSYSGPLKVSSLEIIENTLTLKIKQPFTGVAEDIMVSWGFIVEIDKSVVSGVANSKYFVFSI